jgi:hypothetical protein
MKSVPTTTRKRQWRDQAPWRLQARRQAAYGGLLPNAGICSGDDRTLFRADRLWGFQKQGEAA